jgi:RNA polymerase primary sigma factor
VRDDDALDPAREAASHVARKEVALALSHLQDRERGVLELRYGLTARSRGRSRRSGTCYGVTRERIRQIEKRTLAKLRHPSHARRLAGLSEAPEQPRPATGS